eukprot:jgi/Ulvmu1/3488/UM161_0005.1
MHVKARCRMHVRIDFSGAAKTGAQPEVIVHFCRLYEPSRHDVQACADTCAASEFVLLVAQAFSLSFINELDVGRLVLTGPSVEWHSLSVVCSTSGYNCSVRAKCAIKLCMGPGFPSRRCVVNVSEEFTIHAYTLTVPGFPPNQPHADSE